MSLFWEHLDPRLGESGLFSQAELQEFVESLPEEQKPQDSESLLQALVREKRLTTYQAREIGAGRGQQLVLGNYVVLDRLGQGGMGVVFKAQHLRMQRVVALKVLSPDFTKDPEALRRFQREVVAAARLVHPHVVTAYDADEAKGTHFLVMEYVAGKNLGQIVKDTGPLTVRQAVWCLLQGARGLEYAHQQGVVHRDVKPANLLYDSEGKIKVLDLGLARLDALGGRRDADLTSTGDVMGTIDYMAPEQAESTRLADARSDIYSLGMTLWYLLTGRTCFECESIAAKIMAHREAPLPSLRAARPDAPPELEGVFARLAAKNPAARYQTMSEVIADLEGCLRGLGEATRALNDENELTVRLASMTAAGDETVVFFRPNQESTRRAAALEATVQYSQTVAQPAARRDRAAWALLAAFLGGAAMILLTVFLLLPKGGGNVFIEVTDPDVEVTIDNGAVKIVGAIRQRLALRAGEHDLAVKRGSAELSEKFTVAPSKGTTLLIEVANGVLQVKQDGRLLASVALGPADPDEAPPIARHVLEFSPGNKVEIESLKLSPDGSLTLEAFITALEGAEGEAGLLLGAPQQFALQFDPVSHRLSLESHHADGPHTVGPLEIAPGRKTHVAAVRAANEHRLYIEGILVGRQAIESPLVDSSAPFELGGGFSGTMAEVRVSNVARYEAPFTPEPRHEPDGQTLALFHVSDGPGETLVDCSEHAHEGRILGPRWIPEQAPPPAAAEEPVHYLLELDGATSRAEVKTIRYDGTHPLTLEAWVNVGDRTTNRPIVFVADADGQTMKIAYDWPGRGPSVSIYQDEDGLPETDGGYLVLDDPRPLPAGLNHVAGCWDPGGELSLYVNGLRVGGFRRWGRKYPDETVTHLGTYGKSNRPLHGHLGEVRISRSVRYKKDFAPQLRFEPDAETVALYHFDEGSGELAYDSSGNNHHALLSGARYVRADSIPRAAPAPRGDYALQFDGRSSAVVLPDLRLEEGAPATVEAWATCHQDLNYMSVLAVAGGANSMHISSGESNWGVARNEDRTFNGLAALQAVRPFQRTHLTGVWNGAELKVFVNGKPAAAAYGGTSQGANAVSMLGASIFPECAPLRQMHFCGLIDEVRISSRARYENEFDPPRRFEPDAETLALYHFDEGTGNVLVDSSGHKRHGRVEWAKWVEASREASQDLLHNLTPARDGLVHDPTDGLWKPGAWTNANFILRSGPGRREIYRLPATTIPPTYTLEIEFEADSAEGALLVPFTLANTRCYLVLNGAPRGEERIAGMGDIDDQGHHNNVTTVLHAPLKPRERHRLSVHVKTAGENVEIKVELDGQSLTGFEGAASRVKIIGFDQYYDDVPFRMAVGSMLGSYLFHKVELRVPEGAELPPPRVLPGVLTGSYTSKLGMEFALVPAGKSWLRGPWGVSNTKGFELRQDFYLGKYEVTQQEWEQVMGANPSQFSRAGARREDVKDIPEAELARFPVENVSWLDIQTFLAKLNELDREEGWVYRLPTESEWQYACRGGPLADELESRFDFFTDNPTRTLLSDRANSVHARLNRPRRVGSYQPNRLGLFDMHGNVGEWSDWDSPADPAAPPPPRMSLGGGFNTQFDRCRADSRWPHAETDRVFNLGFRVARIPLPPP